MKGVIEPVLSGADQAAQTFEPLWFVRRYYDGRRMGDAIGL